MKKLKYILIFLPLILFTNFDISQNDNIIIRQIGMLGENNRYFLDGGMGYLNLKIEKCKIKRNRIKLTGQLIDERTNEEIYFFNVYKAENNEKDLTISINDTLIKSDENQLIRKLSNKFSISTKLKPSEWDLF